jgi:hypothetical protein
MPCVTARGSFAVYGSDDPFATVSATVLPRGVEDAREVFRSSESDVPPSRPQQHPPNRIAALECRPLRLPVAAPTVSPMSFMRVP